LTTPSRGLGSILEFCDMITSLLDQNIYLR
jgi:hypothetical protein